METLTTIVAVGGLSMLLFLGGLALAGVWFVAFCRWEKMQRMDWRLFWSEAPMQRPTTARHRAVPPAALRPAGNARRRAA